MKKKCPHKILITISKVILPIVPIERLMKCPEPEHHEFHPNDVVFVRLCLPLNQNKELELHYSDQISILQSFCELSSVFMYKGRVMAEAMSFGFYRVEPNEIIYAIPKGNKTMNSYSGLESDPYTRYEEWISCMSFHPPKSTDQISVLLRRLDNYSNLHELRHRRSWRVRERRHNQFFSEPTILPEKLGEPSTDQLPMIFGQEVDPFSQEIELQHSAELCE